MSRWLSSSRGAMDSNGGDNGGSAIKDAEFIVLPAAVGDAWRTWLMTGTRRAPFDRRRLGGAHRRLKKILIEGPTSPPDRSLPWNDFSSAMVRQAVDEVLNTVPLGHKQAVKLAYFGGFTNREIARHLGVSEAVVRRRLGEALAAVSVHVERGQTLGRKGIFAFAILVAGGRILDFLRRALLPATDQVAQAAVVVAAGVVTASILVGHSPSPAALTQPDRGRAAVTAPAAAATVSVPNVSVPTAAAPKEPVGNVTVPSPSVPAVANPPALPVKVTVPLPVLPIPVPIPSPPSLPSPPPLP